MYGKENRLSLSSSGLPSASTMSLGPSSVAALAQGTTNKRQQMLKYSASRRLSLKLPPKGAKVRHIDVFFSLFAMYVPRALFSGVFIASSVFFFLYFELYVRSAVFCVGRACGAAPVSPLAKASKRVSARIRQRLIKRILKRDSK